MAELNSEAAERRDSFRTISISFVLGFLLVVLGFAWDWLFMEASPGFGVGQMAICVVGGLFMLMNVLSARLCRKQGKPFRYSVGITGVICLWGGILVGIVLLCCLVNHVFVIERRARVASAWGSSTGLSCNVSIPVRSLPDYETVEAIDGGKVNVLRWGHGDIRVKSCEMALIMVDCWGEADSVDSLPKEHYLSTAQLLSKCREHGVTIIHSPNHPVVDEYPQYHVLVDEVQRRTQASFLESFCYGVSEKLRQGQAVRSSRPADFYCSVHDLLRTEALERHSQLVFPSRCVIVPILEARGDEFVAASREEMFYILALRRVKVVMFAGGATNECILHRPIGALNLAGSNYLMILLSDCSLAAPGPTLSAEINQRVMEDYFMRNLGYVAAASDLEWQ